MIYHLIVNIENEIQRSNQTVKVQRKPQEQPWENWKAERKKEDLVSKASP